MLFRLGERRKRLGSIRLLVFNFTKLNYHDDEALIYKEQSMKFQLAKEFHFFSHNRFLFFVVSFLFRFSCLPSFCWVFPIF